MKLDERLRKLTILSEDTENLKTLTIEDREKELLSLTVKAIDELRYFYKEQVDKPLPFEEVDHGIGILSQ